MNTYKKYGAIPEEFYNGIILGEYKHDDYEIDNLLFAMVKSVGASDYGKIKQDSWKKSIESTLNAYLGNPPEFFIYKGKVILQLPLLQKRLG